MMLLRLRWADLPLVMLVIAVAVCCVWLGLWQYERYTTRVVENARVTARMALPQQPLGDLLPLGADDDYRQVTVQGAFLPEYTALFGNREYRGLPGSHLLAAFRVDGQADWLLVDVGWVPLKQGVLENRSDYLPSGTHTLKGMLLPSKALSGWLAQWSLLPSAARPNATWRTVDVAAIAALWQKPLLPLYLEAQPSAANPANPAAVFSGAVSPFYQTEAELSTGSHLGYALQWFSFAIIALVGGWVLLRRQMQA